MRAALAGALGLAAAWNLVACGARAPSPTVSPTAGGGASLPSASEDGADAHAPCELRSRAWTYRGPVQTRSGRVLGVIVSGAKITARLAEGQEHAELELDLSPVTVDARLALTGLPIFQRREVPLGGGLVVRAGARVRVRRVVEGGVEVESPLPAEVVAVGPPLGLERRVACSELTLDQPGVSPRFAAATMDASEDDGDVVLVHAAGTPLPLRRAPAPDGAAQWALAPGVRHGARVIERAPGWLRVRLEFDTPEMGLEGWVPVAQAAFGGALPRTARRPIVNLGVARMPLTPRVRRCVVDAEVIVVGQDGAREVVGRIAAGHEIEVDDGRGGALLGLSHLDWPAGGTLIVDPKVCVLVPSRPDEP